MHRLALLVSLLVFSLAFVLTACSPVIVDSDLTKQEAIYTNQPPDTLEDVQNQLTVVDIEYYGFDKKMHRGQIVVNRMVADDIRDVFTVMRRTRFPVESVIPIAHPIIQLKGPYGLSPDTNNTSAYVWRPIVGSRSISMHALGLAIDINPRLNPYRKGDLVLPPGAEYEPSRPGTLTPDSPVVQTFKKLGWEWGGDWEPQGKVDYMHFQKIPAGLESWVAGYRE